MVNKLNEKPKEYLKDIKDDCIYFELVYKDSPYAYFAFQLFKDTTVLHNEVIVWNHNVAKQAQADFKYILDFLKKIGMKQVIALYPSIDKKWIKFIKMFGFPEPEHLLKSVKEI